MSSAPSATGRAHRLWGGRFEGDSAAEFIALNSSIGVDFRLWPYDVRASKAWAVALWGAGVLTLEESKAIERGLDLVAERLAAGETPGPADEDVHTLIDRLLHDAIGAVASKLHTGRSRNDQVATSSRLWCMDACDRVAERVRELQQVLVRRAGELENVVMPGYTHLQRAIPVSAAHWLLSHFWPLERDRQRLRSAQRAAAILPLGSGALAGCAYPISRTLLQGTLGFDAVTQNSIDAVSDRDFVLELVFASAVIAAHVSRLAEDLIIYGSSEFGFVQFGETFTSGSSMMPQKRNPDALEIARGSAARLLGDHVSLLATIKGLPSSYNKDLQDDKRALFDAVDAMLLVLPGVSGAIAESTFLADRMEAAVSTSMLATDLADYLVRKGTSFRDAHAAVGQLIKRSETDKCDLKDLPHAEFVRASELFADDVADALNVRRSLERRAVEGGTAPAAVRSQLDAAHAALNA